MARKVSVQLFGQNMCSALRLCTPPEKARTLLLHVLKTCQMLSVSGTVSGITKHIEGKNPVMVKSRARTHTHTHTPLPPTHPSFTHSLPRSLAPSLPRSLAPSLARSLAPSLAPSLPQALAPSLPSSIHPGERKGRVPRGPVQQHSARVFDTVDQPRQHLIAARSTQCHGRRKHRCANARCAGEGACTQWLASGGARAHVRARL